MLQWQAPSAPLVRSQPPLAPSSYLLHIAADTNYARIPNDPVYYRSCAFHSAAYAITQAGGVC